jgi:glycine/D-amino acid oxidase-like deaminating enzyme
MQVMTQLSELPLDAAFDVVVVGAGGAGLAASLFAALGGQRVLLVERTAWVGGTTAWSAGTIWVPGTHHATAVNPADTLANAARYLSNAIGERSSAALRQSFLDHGPQAIAFLERHTHVKFRPYAKHPDYLSELEGSTLNGRALEPLPFDGRLLGRWFGLLRPPIPEFTVLGGMMVDRTDINHLLGMTGSWASLRHAVRLVLRHGLDRLRYTRGTRLVMGNALVGRLLYSVSQQAGVTLLLNTSVEALHQGSSAARHEGSRVDGLTLVGEASHGQGDQRRLAAAAGVVLASGGFNRHPQRRADLLPGAQPQWCPGAPGHTGSAQDLALGLGAVYGRGALTPAFWAPVSLRHRADGSTAVFPHFVMDRAKPGMLTVNQAGQRFVNESTSYHLFGLAMRQQGGSGGASAAVPAYLICDATALRRYGLGMVRPGGRGLAPLLADGYLTQAPTLEALAGLLRLPPAALKATVERFNGHAQAGVDPDFGRGETAYQRNLGDPAWPGANPTLGGLHQAPFYALRLFPGDIGAATGLATNAHGGVLDGDEQPINGLYAVGNDMHSIMGGVYTAPGITIGPGLVFAWLASRHMRNQPALPTPMAQPSR